MRWRKLGFIFCATGQSRQMQTGGRAPVPIRIGGSIYRIFFGSCDELGRSRIFSLVIDINNPQKLLDLSIDPVVDLGSLGYYDDNGIIPSWLLQHDGTVYLYTIGFSVKNKVLFDAAPGVAISSDGGVTFNKLTGPVIDRGIDDPCFCTSPCVIEEANLFKMWYVSCFKWIVNENSLKHLYNIRYRASADPVYWPTRSAPAIDFQNEHEYAIARPSVLKEHGKPYRMWYCYREQPTVRTYRMGYAESTDGHLWKRDDSRCDLDISDSGWDSDMVCYPCVFKHDDTTFMLYNGNAYGQSGFGIAVLEE